MKIATLVSPVLIGCLLVSSSCMSRHENVRQSIKNLRTAYRDEITASAKYAAFAQQARMEDYPQIAQLYNAISKSESIHARNHKAILFRLELSPEDFSPKFDLRGTSDNLVNSIEGERQESTNTYIEYIATAEKEGLDDARKSFEWAKDAEMKHLGYFIAALAALSNNRTENLPDSFLVCPECGQTYEARMLEDKCSTCKNSRRNFISFP